MSKKQREKVEDEVRYHKQINSDNLAAANAAAAAAAGILPGANGLSRTHQASGNSPDTTGSVFDTPQPSSTDHL
jgi:hypothetical protein